MDFHTATEPRLVKAAFGGTVDRIPVWMMRQAGRYLPEYMAIRNQTSFLGLCKDVDLAAEVSLQPWRRFGMDAVIMFSDILIPVEAMGMPLVFEEGPHLPQPIRSRADVEKLSIPDPVEKTGFVMNLIKRLRSDLSGSPDTALIGFAGAPWTLASYMIEGGTSRNYTQIKAMMWNEPKTLHMLLDKAAQTVTHYLNAQIEAGAQVVQLFDSWAGIVDSNAYQEFILPYHQQVISGLKRQGVPVILYVNGSRGLLPLMMQAGADVISVDWLTPLAEAKQIIGASHAVQGNLDSNALFADPSVVVPMAQALAQTGGMTGYIFNLGHGILPKTPPETVKAVVDAVHAYQPSATLTTSVGR